MSKARNGDGPRPILVRNAWENNLQGVSLELPNGRLVAVSGASGAGKSSLVHHVLGRIGRRRIGRLRGVMTDLAASYQPSVEAVAGLPPCVEVKQEPLRGHTRSTIASYTGILDLAAALYQHHGASASESGSPVEDLDRLDFASWLSEHYEGRSVRLARITPEMDLVSVAQLPHQGTIYYRDRNSAWNQSTRAGLKALLPARLWIAIPDSGIVTATTDTVRGLIRNPSQGWLWIIDGSVYIEGHFHRLSGSDPLPYLPLGRRLFSFNSQALGSGQCEVCHGTGIVRAVGESTLIQDPDAPLLSGGLSLPRTGERFTHLGALDSTLRALFHLNHLLADATWQQVPAEVRQTLLYGSGKVLVPELRSGDKHLTKAKRPFPGLISLVAERSQSAGGAAKALQHLVAQQECPACKGSRYNRSARSCRYRGLALADLMTRKTIGELHTAVQGWTNDASHAEKPLLSSLDALLDAYVRLNLTYLHLGRSTGTLSGGESQRIRLGLGLALRLRNCCYLLDEPSRGLHAQDAVDLARTIQTLSDGNNTILMVEHNPILLGYADHLVVLGPGGGHEGGRVIYEGKPGGNIHKEELGSADLAPVTVLPAKTDMICVTNLSVNNVRGAAFTLPAGKLTAVVGVSGAGKSSAILKGLVPAVEARLAGSATAGTCSLSLPKRIKFVEVVAQKMLGQNRRSIVATALEIFDQMRGHFAGLDISRFLGLKAPDFSFNSDGACEACGGTGAARDGFGNETDESCHVCGGQRLRELPLLAQSNGLSLNELLDKPVAELARNDHPSLNADARERLSLMVELGLGHLQLSRATPTLSAGERQRLGIVRFMARIESHQGDGLLVLDEPTAGLSAADAQRVFRKLADLAHSSGHTLIVIEHKLNLLRTAHWIIEFGPGGGPAGGKVLFQGSYEKLLAKSTPSSEALQGSSSQVSPRRPPTKASQADATVESPFHVADVFESFVANQEVREDQQAVHPLHPVISLDPARFPADARVVEMLDLLPLLRKQCQPKLPDGIIARDSIAALDEAVHARAFGFSPVAPQRRLGLATPADFVVACKQLQRLGLEQVWRQGRVSGLAEAIKPPPSSPDFLEYWVVCSAGADSPVRQVALRWSQGLVRLMDGTDDGTLYSTQFLPGDDAAEQIGVSLDDPHVGDCRSPSGRCLFCGGSGRLPVYPIDQIIADRSKTVADDLFWHPAILPPIRSLRRSRIIPEARFFTGQGVADFLQPFKRMCERTAFLFENGIPWRRFLKPAAKRSDRTQDYFSWRGLHDYVYMVLGKIEEGHKQRLKDEFRQRICQSCQGTGAGWESAHLHATGTTLLDLLGKRDLLAVSKALDINTPAVRAALRLDLGGLRLSDRFADLSVQERSRLVFAAACTASLENLALVVEDVDQLTNRQLLALLSRQGMSIAATRHSKETS